jgi:hypothetical protein
VKRGDEIGSYLLRKERHALAEFLVALSVFNGSRRRRRSRQS